MNTAVATRISAKAAQATINDLGVQYSTVSTARKTKTDSPNRSFSQARKRPVIAKPSQISQIQLLNKQLTKVGNQQCPDAYTAIYSHFAGRIKSFLIGKGINDDIAEELMQEVMIIVWRRACTFDQTKAAASTWIFTIARNRRIDYLRGTPRVEIELEDSLLQLESDDLPAEQQVDILQDATRLHSAIEKLPAEQRKVMHLSFFKGESHSDIATRLGLPMGTVKSRIRLAMRSIRNNLQEEQL